MNKSALIWFMAAVVALVASPAWAEDAASAPVSDRAVMKTKQQRIEKAAAVVKNNRMSKCRAQSGDEKKGCEKQAKADAEIVKREESSEHVDRAGSTAAKPRSP
jgi:hypothetical protein